MKLILFFFEIAIVLSFLKMHYGISLKDILNENISLDNKNFYEVKLTEPIYSSYYSEDIIGNDVLLLDNLSETKKLDIWKSTSTKNEVLDFFPNMEMMKNVFNNKIEDNGKFKTCFLNYMEKQHSKYIAGEINSQEFKEFILNPSSSLTNSW